MAISVVLDACVLVPHPLFDTLLRLADAGMFRPLWSAQILIETERTLTGKLGLTPVKASRRMEQMQRAFPGALVEGYEELIPAMTNDPKDRHVLAAAVRADATLLVTANLSDFPPESVRSYDIEVLHPDEFLLAQLDLAPDAVLSCLRDQRAAYTNPDLSAPEFYQAFVATVPEFAHRAESLERGPAREALVGEVRPMPAQLPLPIERVREDEVAAAFFPGEDPEPTTPLGAAYLWWACLLRLDEYRDALEMLTSYPHAWKGFTEAAEQLDGWALAQKVHPNEDHPEQAAYVKLIPDPGSSGRAFADAPLYDVQVLTLLRHDDGWWRVWGLSHNYVPTWEEITA